MKIRVKLFTIIIFLCGFFVTNLYAKAGNLEEIKLRMAFIFKFAEFVDNNQKLYLDSNINLCVFGRFNQEVVNFYKKLSLNKTIFGKKIITFINVSGKKTTDCEILYFDSSFKGDLARYSVFTKKGVLTIGYLQGFLRNRGIIEFFEFRGKIRFKINNNEARDRGIMFNAKLLELAKINDRL